jgi:hypothetical protein
MNINKTHIMFFIIGLNIALIYLYLNTNNIVLIKEHYKNKKCNSAFTSDI